MIGTEYNYERFDDYVARGADVEEFTGFPGHLHAGEPAPDFVASRLDNGAEMRLSELWRNQPVVIEFGSFTGPSCAAEGPLLDEIADRHTDHGWVFVYTREAYPGEKVPHYDTFERKLDHARLLRDETGIRRPILVDDLAGTGHRAYGSLPNMVWVIGRGGRILYKAAWTSAANVEAFVERNRAARE